MTSEQPTGVKQHDQEPESDPDLRAGLRWWRELAYIAVFYGAYSTIRNQFGSASVESEVAWRHAMDVIDVERSVGLFFEPTLQGWFVDAKAFLVFWNIFYGTFHFVVTAGVLLWLYKKFPERYAFWRTALLATTGLALLGFALYPLMPPRLLCECPYGSGEDFGFVDTLKVHGSLWSFGEGPMQKISNQYAAMPSLHFGWATWCFLALRTGLARRSQRLLAFSYPWLTLFAIVVTANHFWLDALGGAVVLASGLGLSTLVHRVVVPRVSAARPSAVP